LPVIILPYPVREKPFCLVLDSSIEDEDDDEDE
jgi:hypothetical protein